MRMNIEGVIGELTTLPGCSQVCVSHGVFVPRISRGKGKGTKANTKRLDVMRKLGYDYAIATVDKANEPQMKIMHKNGWVMLDSFTSSKTGHLIAIFGRAL